MRRYVTAAALVLAFTSMALATDVYKTKVTTTNATSTASSAVAPGLQYSVVCTAKSRYRTCTTTSCTATTDDYPLEADRAIDVGMPNNHTAFAFYGDGAGGTCRIYQVTPAYLPGF